jgi:hypothetical protein
MTAFTERASRTGQIGNDPKPPDLVVRWPEIERRVLSALAAVGERGVGRLPASRPRFPWSRDLSYSVHSSICSEMLSASSTSMPR